jgi:hypothetical protein
MLSGSACPRPDSSTNAIKVRIRRSDAMKGVLSSLG